jgi:hypothetical protein
MPCSFCSSKVYLHYKLVATGGVLIILKRLASSIEAFVSLFCPSQRHKAMQSRIEANEVLSMFRKCAFNCNYGGTIFPLQLLKKRLS